MGEKNQNRMMISKGQKAALIMSTPPVFIAMVAAAVIFSLIACYFAITADQVNITALNPATPSTPDATDLSLAQVKELQRSNDRILATVWGALGAVFTIAVLFTGINVVQARITSDRELETLSARTKLQVDEGVRDLETKTNTLGNELSALKDGFDLQLITLSTQLSEVTRTLHENEKRDAKLLFQVYWLFIQWVVTPQSGRARRGLNFRPSFPLELLDLARRGGDAHQIDLALSFIRRQMLGRNLVSLLSTDFPAALLGRLMDLPSEFQDQAKEMIEEVSDAMTFADDFLESIDSEPDDAAGEGSGAGGPSLEEQEEPMS